MTGFVSGHLHQPDIIRLFTSNDKYKNISIISVLEKKIYLVSQINMLAKDRICVRSFAPTGYN